MAALAILQADARVAARLSAALSGDHEIVVCPSWDSLHRSLSGKGFDGCLVDADHPDREAATRQIEILLQRYPRVAIVACVEASHGLGYYDLGGLGVAGVLVARPQHASKIRAVVDRALATARAERVALSLEGRYRAPGPDAIGWAVEHAGSDASVEKLAAALGHTPRSLRQALEDAGLPAPTRVLLWGRLLLAGARLACDGRTVEDVAFSLGYSTATSLTRAMKRQTGLTPGQVSRHGGMERVRDALFPKRDDPRRTGSRLGRIASLALLAVLTGCAALAGVPPGVDRTAIDDLLRSPPADRVHFGVLVVDARTGRTLYARDAHRWFVPASNQKILVTAAAWSLLGPNYRFRTEIWATGPSPDGLIHGDLVLVGSGDPSLSARYWKSGTAAVEALADSVRKAGVEGVTGSLVVDVSAWDSTTVGPTREVDDLPHAYASTGGAFAIDEGEVTVVVRAGTDVGAPAALDWSPRGSDDFVRSRIETAPADSVTRVSAHYLPETRRLVLDGIVGHGRVDTLSFAQRDPVREAGAVLARAIARAGIGVEGGWNVRWIPEGAFPSGCVARLARECPRAQRIAVLGSPRLADLVAGVLGPSQNWMAEQLVRTLGAERGAYGSWPEGLRVIRSFLTQDVGVDSLDVSARDGSGQSAYDLVTPRALVRVLQYMRARSDAVAYRSAMAEPGEEDTTLEERLSDLEGRLFAKTGSISNVNALSGYLMRDNGQEVIFSILSNGAGLDPQEVRTTIDAVVRVLAR